jgi:glycosyltransferase involved in cell wall biosynthesis
VDSVALQTYADREYLVVDGCSTDGTLDLLDRLSDRIDYWVSEPDRGLFDAMNKGIGLARGEWLLFLGADDELADEGALEACIEALRQAKAGGAPDPVLLYGDAVYSNGIRFRSAFTARLLLRNTIHHQASLYHRSLFDGFLYDPSLHHVADYELNLLLYLHRRPVLRVDRLLARCGFGGVSSDYSNRGPMIQELNLIRGRHVSPPVQAAMRAILGARLLGRRLLRCGS